MAEIKLPSAKVRAALECYVETADKDIILDLLAWLGFTAFFECDDPLHPVYVFDNTTEEEISDFFGG